ncbi:MAG: hypothetical protein GY737_26895 [Desulfobacteraceae bacterium]|nr:hypothetical protein [Desulfobacteraceae bacterium]
MGNPGLFVLLIAVFGLGFLILIFWYIKTRATALTVTDHELVDSSVKCNGSSKSDFDVFSKVGPDSRPAGHARAFSIPEPAFCY